MLPREDHRRTTVLKQGELVTEIRIPIPEWPGRGIFLKSMERKAWAFALAGVALQLRLDGDRVVEGRLVLGGVAPIPWRAKEAEKVFIGQKISEGLVQRTGETAVSEVRPMRDNVYKVQLAQALVRKALTALRTPDS